MEGLLLICLVQVLPDDRDLVTVYVQNEYFPLPFLMEAGPLYLHCDILRHIGHQPEVLKTYVVLLFGQANI